MNDPRLDFGVNFIRLHQSASLGPIKIGLAHRERWVGYHVDQDLFVKRFELLDNETYPDGGANFETFTNEEMLEVESLGPLVTLEPGQYTQDHVELWSLIKVPANFDAKNDDAVRSLVT